MTGQDPFAHDLPVDQVLHHDPPGALGSHPAANNPGFVLARDLNQRFMFAQSGTPRLCHRNPPDVPTGKLVENGREDLPGTGGNAAFVAELTDEVWDRLPLVE